MAVRFLIVALAGQVELRVVSVRRVVLRDSFPAAAVPCTLRAPSPAALREVLVQVSDSVPASAPRAQVLAVHAPEWVALPG